MRVFLTLLVLMILVSGCVPQTGVMHVVKPEETLAEIAHAYKQDWRYLAKMNDLDDPRLIFVDQKIYVPGVNSHKNLSPTKVANVRVGKKKADSIARSRPISPSRSTTRVGNMKGSGIFKWPVSGSVVRKFGRSGGTQCNGVEISVPVGSAVRASSPGVVIYAGEAVAGFGRLVIIQHAKEYYTVYGYNSEIKAKRGDQVSQGDVIAKAGVGPAGERGLLHFELRKGKNPVDPLKHLRGN